MSATTDTVPPWRPTCQEIIDAYRQTEIVPVWKTWRYRMTTERGDKVACGCAIIALLRSKGLDVTHFTNDFHLALDRVGLSNDTASGLIAGWDRPADVPSWWQTDDFNEAFSAASAASKIIFRERGNDVR